MFWRRHVCSYKQTLRRNIPVYNIYSAINIALKFKSYFRIASAFTVSLSAEFSFLGFRTDPVSVRGAALHEAVWQPGVGETAGSVWEGGC